MKFKELQEKIIRLESELAKVKETTEIMKGKFNREVFKPKLGQKYWFVSASGDIYEGEWINHPLDHNGYLIGNCFPTERAAINTVQVLKLIQKAKELQNGFVPNWEDMLQNKYSVRFFMGDIEISTCQLHNEASIFGYWEYQWACAQFIKDNYKELLWFFTQYQG